MAKKGLRCGYALGGMADDLTMNKKGFMQDSNGMIQDPNTGTMVRPAQRGEQTGLKGWKPSFAGSMTQYDKLEANPMVNPLAHGGTLEYSMGARTGMELDRGRDDAVVAAIRNGEADPNDPHVTPALRAKAARGFAAGGVIDPISASQQHAIQALGTNVWGPAGGLGGRGRATASRFGGAYTSSGRPGFASGGYAEIPSEDFIRQAYANAMQQFNTPAAPAAQPPRGLLAGIGDYFMPTRPVREGTITGGVRAAEGGKIPGDDPHETDSVPAKLTRGEYVLPRATTEFLGVDFLDRLVKMTNGKEPGPQVVDGEAHAERGGGIFSYLPSNVEDTYDATAGTAKALLGGVALPFAGVADWGRGALASATGRENADPYRYTDAADSHTRAGVGQVGDAMNSRASNLADMIGLEKKKPVVAPALAPAANAPATPNQAATPGAVPYVQAKPGDSAQAEYTGESQQAAPKQGLSREDLATNNGRAGQKVQDMGSGVARIGDRTMGDRGDRRSVLYTNNTSNVDGFTKNPMADDGIHYGEGNSKEQYDQATAQVARDRAWLAQMQQENGTAGQVRQAMQNIILGGGQNPQQWQEAARYFTADAANNSPLHQAQAQRTMAGIPLDQAHARYYGGQADAAEQAQASQRVIQQLAQRAAKGDQAALEALNQLSQAQRGGLETPYDKGTQAIIQGRVAAAKDPNMDPKQMPEVMRSLDAQQAALDVRHGRVPAELENDFRAFVQQNPGASEDELRKAFLRRYSAMSAKREEGKPKGVSR